MIEEAADCLEVLRAIVGEAGTEWSEVECKALLKRAERGGFDRRIWLE